MSGKRRLRGDKPRLLGNHRGQEGRLYDRAYGALEADLGPFRSALVRFEAGRTAVAMVNLQVATEALTTARRQREQGRGRRPSAQALERLSRRQGLCDGSYSQALAKLQELTARTREPQDLASRLARLHREGSGG